MYIRTQDNLQLVNSNNISLIIITDLLGEYTLTAHLIGEEKPVNLGVFNTMNEVNDIILQMTDSAPVFKIPSSDVQAINLENEEVLAPEEDLPEDGKIYEELASLDYSYPMDGKPLELSKPRIFCRDIADDMTDYDEESFDSLEEDPIDTDDVYKALQLHATKKLGNVTA